ncbi:heavy-metal-associated domain-containing protein [Ferruginibacter sp.]|uniref:heavy-metal-associated domain-containing protein n=1 Tax=Ferruginibacter sp. TaxID=1940288 RepID=UPI0019C66BF5|nr:heavy metal-associated domain-containing protein [Ferruginibacter sp.]MBC7628745.1 heavy-metal-associated domain-containing protein [Ferruginibacter sp.]
MKKKYELSGMSCGGCVNSVRQILLQIPDVIAAEIQLNPPTAVLTMNKDIALEKLQEQLAQSGNYTIRDLISKT